MLIGSPKNLALDLVEQIIRMDKLREAEYLKLLAEKHIYPQGESAVTFHLKSLKELIGQI